MTVICTKSSNTKKLCILPTQCMFVIRTIVTVNTKYLAKHHLQSGPCSSYKVFSVRQKLMFYIHEDYK